MRQASWFAPHPPYALKGEGCWIIDVDGRRILDCANNFFSLVHGHAFPPVIEALRSAMERGTAFGLPTESEIELAELLAARSPFLQQTRFCNSGTEAVMHAIKGARALTGRHRIAKFEGCYHGAYDYIEVGLESSPDNWDGPDGSLASTPYAKGTPPSVLTDTVVLPYDDAVRCEAILRTCGSSLAAVVLDPHASRAGMMPMPPEVIAAVQAACRRDGIMLIADEVICFRLSYAGASPLYGIEPDFVTLAKVIGGGLPVGAVSGSPERMSVFDHSRGKPAVAMGGTFSANPMSMAAGLATLRHYDRSAVARLNGLGDKLRERVNEAFAANQSPARLVGTGSLFRLHLGGREITGYRSSYPTTAEATALHQIHGALLASGILLTPNCSGALTTPMTDKEIAFLADTLTSAALKTSGWG
ncbi:aspartate aminotransferase family protein [Bosea sp. 2KB_26]|uniref:aspartate aminotransferase family protein n=1 Tax=Bosea sp. 2KB_26 TaxID=3237475 RepID=UPI003F928250